MIFRSGVLILCLCSFINVYAQKQTGALREADGKTNLLKYLDEKKWNVLFPNRNNIAKGRDFYSLGAFVAAAKKLPLFLSEGDEQTQKRELCAFLANIAQETSGGWDAAPGGYFKWGLYYLQEQGCENGCAAYSDTNNKDYPPVKGVSYHGRGPKQLSWNYNYGQFGTAYYGDKNVLLQHPEQLVNDPVLAFASAIWFWMTPQRPKPSCHDIMTGKWVPTAIDLQDNRKPGFGATINVINGGIECGTAESTKTKYRYEYYKLFCKYFKVDPGSNIECSSQKPFNVQ